MKNFTYKQIIEEYLPKYVQLITFCESLGYQYSPKNNDVRVSALIEQYNDALSCAQNLLEQVIAYNKASNYRIQKFAGVIAFLHRWSLELAQSSASPSLKYKMQSLTDNARGVKVLKSSFLVPHSQYVGTGIHSPSKKLYRNVVQYMIAILDLARTISDYNPSESDLELTQVETYIRELEVIDNQVQDTLTTLNSLREHLSYLEGGLLFTEQACINYLYSILDSDHYFFSEYLSTSSKLKTSREVYSIHSVIALFKLACVSVLLS